MEKNCFVAAASHARSPRQAPPQPVSFQLSPKQKSREDILMGTLTTMTTVSERCMFLWRVFPSLTVVSNRSLGKISLNGDNERFYPFLTIAQTKKKKTSFHFTYILLIYSIIIITF